MGRTTDYSHQPLDWFDFDIAADSTASESPATWTTSSSNVQPVLNNTAASVISPGFLPPTSPARIRGKGARKKNPPFNIPPERTLQNIDQLISESTNEKVTKELKKEKRLLRNRAAAYDSPR
jgi:hypothetical protein